MAVFLASGLVILVVCVLLFERLGHNRGDALMAGVVFVWFAAFFERILGWLGRLTSDAGPRWFLLVVLLLLIAAGLVLLAEMFKRGHGASVTLIVAVVGVSTLVQHADAMVGTSSVLPVTESMILTTEEDVWVLIIDELSSPQYLTQYGADDPSIMTLLQEYGFSVPLTPASPYSQTYPTLSAMLSLEPLYPGVYGAETWAAHAPVFGGDHPLSRSFADAARQVVLMLPPITPAYCSDIVSLCFRPLLDDFDRFVIRNSVFSAAIPESQEDWPHQSLAQMEQLEEVAESPGTGRLILAHLMLAHAPYTFDANCVDTNQPSYSTENYAEQVECLTAKMSVLLEKISEEAVVLIVSDHGIALGQPYPMDTQEERDQRLSAFVAIRGCELSEEFLDSNINAYRGLVNCVTNASLDAVSLPPTLTCFRERDTIELVEIQEDHTTELIGCDA